MIGARCGVACGDDETVDVGEASATDVGISIGIDKSNAASGPGVTQRIFTNFLSTGLACLDGHQHGAVDVLGWRAVWDSWPGRRARRAGVRHLMGARCAVPGTLIGLASSVWGWGSWCRGFSR